ncbi:hypothetical protein ACJMK2_041756 [Sinanodonta woodiana]|uniref:NADAR domain-containing protein n=1 Tax=Sinanodonta woodiana TaxID=1069815 RepID=A0ABD3W578_SINWO
MISWVLKALKQISCQREVSNSVDTVPANWTEPVKGHEQAITAWPQELDGKNGSQDTVGRELSDEYTSVKNEHQRHNVTCSNKKDEKKIIHPEFEFFWLEDSPFSQWYQSKFIVDEQIFLTAEQYMMYHKAKLFNDDEAARKILTEVSPRKQKKLGRHVKNFSDETWKRNCIEIVKEGNKFKFLQNKDLLQILFSTYPKTLVEASPYDRVWGIGMAASDPRAQTKDTWVGSNLLGYALTDVRNELMHSNVASTCPNEKQLMMIQFDEKEESTYL